MKLINAIGRAIVVLTLIVVYSCSSETIDIDRQDLHNLKMEFTPKNTNSSIDDSEYIDNIRIVIAEQRSSGIEKIVKNLKYNIGANMKKYQLIVSDVPSGEYSIYVFANEDLLELQENKNSTEVLDNLYYKSELYALSTYSMIAKIKDRVPYIGKQDNIIIDKQHTNISVPLVRAISKFIIEIENTGDTAIGLSNITFGNILEAKHHLFTNEYSILSPTPQVLNLNLSLGNWIVNPAEKREVTTFLYETKSYNLAPENVGLSLSLTTNMGSVYEPIKLKENVRGYLEHITPNTVYSIKAKITGNKIIQFELNTLEWDKVENRLPIYE